MMFENSCNLHSTDPQMTLDDNHGGAGPKPNGAMQQQAFHLLDLEETFGRLEGFDL